MNIYTSDRLGRPKDLRYPPRRQFAISHRWKLSEGLTAQTDRFQPFGRADVVRTPGLWFKPFQSQNYLKILEQYLSIIYNLYRISLLTDFFIYFIYTSHIIFLKYNSTHSYHITYPLIILVEEQHVSYCGTY